MAVIASALTTLADVKLYLRIPTAVTTDDALIENMINSASISLTSYCQRVFARATYTDEIKAVNNRPLLALRQWPIVTVTSVKQDDVTLAATEYASSAEDYAAGMLYRERGWAGRALVAGLTDDPVAGARIYKITYTAGYYMPSDVTTAPAEAHYVAGSATSLPMDISMACAQFVAGIYQRAVAGGNGLTSYSEGGVSWGWADPAAYKNNVSGIPDAVAGVLNKYRRTVITA